MRQFKFDKFECRDHIRQLKEFITFRRNCLCEFDNKTRGLNADKRMFVTGV